MEILEAALVVVFIGCFAGAAVLSAGEVSIIRVRRSEVLLEAQGGSRSSRLLDIIDDLPVVLNTVLLVVLLCQVTAATIAGFLAERWFGGLGVTAATVLVTVMLFIYAEAVPKTRAVLSPRRTALRLTPTLWLVARLLQPAVRVLIRLAGMHSGTGITTLGVLTEAEIRALAKESAEAGEIAADDAELVDRSFTFNDRSVAEVMVPRSEVVAVAADSQVIEAMSVAISAGHRRLLVHGDGLDDVVGVVRLRDLAAAALAEPSTTTSTLMTGLLRCETDEPISGLLRRMQLSGRWLAVVTSGGGRTSGLITIEDIVAELVGEIADERDALHRRDDRPASR